MGFHPTGIVALQPDLLYLSQISSQEIVLQRHHVQVLLLLLNQIIYLSATFHRTAQLS
jgi:hypothetical protein